MNKKKYYKKIFSYFKSEKKFIGAYILTAIIIIIINTILPLLSAKSLNAITSSHLSLMVTLAFLTFIIYLFNDLFRYLNDRSGQKIQNNVEIKIKADASQELFNLQMQNFDREGTGFFATRIENEPRVIAHIFSSLRFNITSILTSMGVFLYIFYICPLIGIFFFLVSAVNFIISLRRTKRWEEERKEDNKMHEKYTSNFNELIRGIKDIKVLNLKNYLISKTIKDQKELILFNYQMSKKDQKSYMLTSFIHYLMDFLLIIIGVVLIKQNMLTGASFLVIYMYKSRAIYFFDDINSLYRNYKEFNLSLERLYELIDSTKYPKEKFGTKKLNNLKGTIEFQNVSFGYNNDGVLKNISFKIDACQTIGIVGKSGAGKTTIINLINKLYDINKGNIFIDGEEIKEITEDSLRKNISTITQNPYIFNMSIKDNLKVVNPNITDKEIKEKCKLCALDKYINSLPKKYDTLVGENGVILSGGLKQRLAIARALIKNSKIIILDEATSSLDNETQDYIHHSIKKIRKDFTIIIIAHRLSTVIDCHKILVIDDGKVVGFDTHENLIKNNKIYQQLYKKELI